MSSYVIFKGQERILSAGHQMESRDATTSSLPRNALVSFHPFLSLTTVSDLSNIHVLIARYACLKRLSCELFIFANPVMTREQNG